MVPFLPSRIPSLLPTHRSLPPSVTGGTAVAHARDREACESEISRQKAASITQTAERRRPWSFRLTSTMACRRGQRRGGHCGSAIPFFFTSPFYSALFPVALGNLTSNASLKCLRFAEVYVDEKCVAFPICNLTLLSWKLPCLATRQLGSFFFAITATVFGFFHVAPHWNRA